MSTPRERANAFREWCYQEGVGIGSDGFLSSLELTIKNAINSRVAALEAVLKGTREVLALCQTKPWYPKATPEFPLVRDLCERHGYGAVIACASSQWMEALESKGYPMGGAHTAGPCAITVEYTLNLIDAALRG